MKELTHHDTDKRIREFIIGNSRFLIQNLLKLSEVDVATVLYPPLLITLLYKY